MVNFSCATPWLLHASLFSRKDDIVREHPPCELRISCISRIRTAHSPDVRGCAGAETESPPPSKEDSGLRCSRIDGGSQRVRCRELDGGRGARDRTAGALQGTRQQMPIALPAAQDAPESLNPRPATRDLLPFAGVVQDVERHGVAAGAVAQAFRHAGDGGCRRPRGLLDGSV